MKRRFKRGDDGIFRERHGLGLESFTVDAQGILRNERDDPLGRVDSLTVELYGAEGEGGPRSSLLPSPSSLPKDGVERRENVGVGTEVGGVVGEPQTLPGLDEGLSLYTEWIRVFERDAAKLRYSPSRQRAAKRALAEAPLDVLIKALEGARAYRKLRPGSEEFTDIFGTFRGTGDLASRISFFVEQAENAQKAPAQNALFTGIPSAQHGMIRERMRHVEAWLTANPGEASSRREAGELAEKWLLETCGLRPVPRTFGRIGSGERSTTVYWEREAVRRR